MIPTIATIAPEPVDPLDMLPNRVNPALSGAHGDSDLFPMDAEWLVLLHDKGQLSRATPEWVGDLFAHKASQGEDPAELACRCWVLALMGTNGASSKFAALLAHAPEAAHACFDDAGTKPIFARFAAEFADASRSWTAPEDMAVRGWGKMRTERSIQDCTRERYAILAQACAQAAAVGLQGILRDAIERPTWRDLAGPFHEPLSQVALGIVLHALAAGAGKDSWARRERPVLAREACLRFSPKSFRKTLALLEASPGEMIALAGTAIGLALRVAGAPEENPDDPKAPSRATMRFQEAMRASAALAYFCHWSIGNSTPTQDFRPLFFDNVLGSPLGEASGRVLDELCQNLPSRKENLMTFCLALANHAKWLGFPLACSERTAQRVWSSHLGPSGTRHSPGFVNRHLALAAHFPSVACEASSYALATGEQLSAIEEAQLRSFVPAFEHDAKVAAEPREDGSAPDDDAPAPARKRMRL